ncbi:hypothetical protein T439DRAFT_152199 [Meredithblackwellia eburnea MCA 4105]
MMMMVVVVCCFLWTVCRVAKCGHTVSFLSPGKTKLPVRVERFPFLSDSRFFFLPAIDDAVGVNDGGGSVGMELDGGHRFVLPCNRSLFPSWFRRIDTSPPSEFVIPQDFCLRWGEGYLISYVCFAGGARPDQPPKGYS